MRPVLRPENLKIRLKNAISVPKDKGSEQVWTTLTSFQSVSEQIWTSRAKRCTVFLIKAYFVLNRPSKKLTAKKVRPTLLPRPRFIFFLSYRPCVSFKKGVLDYFNGRKCRLVHARKSSEIKKWLIRQDFKSYLDCKSNKVMKQNSLKFPWKRKLGLNSRCNSNRWTLYRDTAEKRDIK